MTLTRKWKLVRDSKKYSAAEVTFSVGKLVKAERIPVPLWSILYPITKMISSLDSFLASTKNRISVVPPYNTRLVLCRNISKGLNIAIEHTGSMTITKICSLMRPRMLP